LSGCGKIFEKYEREMKNTDEKIYFANRKVNELKDSMKTILCNYEVYLGSSLKYESSI